MGAKLGLYRRMARARAFELLMAELWRHGLISAELHLGTGEEAVAAAVASRLRDGDAMALDHRSTTPIAALGIDLYPFLAEVLGRPDGVGRGAGGHMHLLDPDHLIASSGIVGSAGPLGAGFALAAKRLRPGAVAVAFFGDGAANQGMLLETLNLAVVWSLPLVLVCKDNGWAITTRAEMVTAGKLVDRARGFGMTAEEVDGGDAFAAEAMISRAVSRAREGLGPMFIRARCRRLDGHLLGDLMMRSVSRPVREGRDVFGRVAAATLARNGGTVGERARGLGKMMGVLASARVAEGRGDHHDPLVRVRSALRKHASELSRIDGEVGAEMDALRARVLLEGRRWAG